MIPRSEHPKPQFERDTWMCLNGEWEFYIDNGKSGIERKMFCETEESAKAFDRKIIVPFCPESKLSGIENRDFMECVWYRRKVTLSGKDISGRVILHFGAVDYKCHVWINSKPAGVHIGGYSSFCFDVTDLVSEGENTITVCAIDELRAAYQPAGKQSTVYNSFSAWYTRTTGIWQSVWFEFVPVNYVKSIKITPDIDSSRAFIDCKVTGSDEISFTALYEGKPVGKVTGEVKGDNNKFVLDLSELHLWECGKGRLYDLVIEYGEDRVKSYFGMRKVELDGYKFRLNGKAVFQRTVLDQGFYPDGIYTAPNDEALLNDIKISMDAGFNGARLHQKIFEERFLYYADREGYMVWGEHANWGHDISDPKSLMYFLPEWLEAVERDYNHPSIIGWCPFNETFDYQGKRQQDLIVSNIWNLTKALDTTRPCIDTSGHYHVVTDIYDVHNYEQNVEEFKRRFAGFPEDEETFETYPGRQHYTKGLPLYVSEYGGAFWQNNSEGGNAWGYGNAPKTVDEYLDRYEGLTRVLLEHPYIMGFCFTQLYDIEQEQNGIYNYDRTKKFDIERIRRVNTMTAAIEEE